MTKIRDMSVRHPFHRSCTHKTTQTQSQQHTDKQEYLLRARRSQTNIITHHFIISITSPLLLLDLESTNHPTIPFHHGLFRPSNPLTPSIRLCRTVVQYIPQFVGKSGEYESRCDLSIRSYFGKDCSECCQ